MTSTDPDPAALPQLAPRFPALDTLRAVGALAVLTTHTMFWAGDYVGRGWLGGVWARLDVGVALFFVLSGFLLSRPWFARRVVGQPPPGTGRYLWKRLLRIYPVYVVTAVIALSLLAGNQNAGPGDWMVTLLLADTYVHTSLPAGLTQMWSLAVEVAFYLVLPLLLSVLVGRRRRWRPTVTAIGLVGLCAVSVWWVADGAWATGLLDTAMPLQWLPGFLSWFALGIGLAGLHVWGAGPGDSRVGSALLRGARAMGGAPGACSVAALGLLLVASTQVAGPWLLETPAPGDLVVKQLLYLAVAGLLVTPAIFAEEGSRYLRWMSLPALRHLGHISYSLFCVHLPVLHFVMWWRDLTIFDSSALEVWGWTLGLSLLASEALYRLVELPAQRLRRVGGSHADLAAPQSTSATATATSHPGQAHVPAQPDDDPHGRAR